MTFVLCRKCTILTDNAMYCFDRKFIRFLLFIILGGKMKKTKKKKKEEEEEKHSHFQQCLYPSSLVYCTPYILVRPTQSASLFALTSIAHCSSRHTPSIMSHSLSCLVSPVFVQSSLSIPRPFHTVHHDTPIFDLRNRYDQGIP